jgi:hypothetical protein
MWKEAVMEVLSQHLPEGTEEDHEKPQLGQLVSRLRFEPRASQI